jgi:hypothetical protein
MPQCWPGRSVKSLWNKKATEIAAHTIKRKAAICLTSKLRLLPCPDKAVKHARYLSYLKLQACVVSKT